MSKLTESVARFELKRLVHTTIHIDEYKSKMGDDADICVFSFKVSGNEPAQDLAEFIEKGYQCVLDADVSAGELEHGDYLVFVEIQRTYELPHQILEIIDGVNNLTDTKMKHWDFRYNKSPKHNELTFGNLLSLVPLNAEMYKMEYGEEEEPLHVNPPMDLDQLKTDAGLPVNTKAPDDEISESIRIMAGIR